MFRENIRRHDSLAAHMPDSLVDAAMQMQYGDLSPGQCVARLMIQSSAPVAPTIQTPTQVSRRESQIQGKQVSEAIKAAIISCKNKRLSGELKNFLASTNCSNPLITQIFANIRYPYMDLIVQLTAKRLAVAERIDTGELSEGDGQLELAKFMTYLQDIEYQRAVGRQN
jgi:hypothetical protein